MPWEETEDYIRSGHRNSDDFEKDSLRTITINEEDGIKAVAGKPKGKDTMEIQSYLFAKAKDWTLDKAKAWFEEHKPVKEHVHAVLPFKIVEKTLDKPLRIRGVAMTTGMSRNFNIYTPEELSAFAEKLNGAPVYIEHVTAANAVGKVEKTEWDGERLWYEAEIYESTIAEKIRNGLIQHVSVGADYETIDVVDGKIPHGLHNAELSFVAVPGIRDANVSVLESLVHNSMPATGKNRKLVKVINENLKEQNGEVACVVCGAPADFLVSICQKCLAKTDSFPEVTEFFAGIDLAKGKGFSALVVVEKVGDHFVLREQQIDPLVAGEYLLGFYQDPALFLPEHFRTIWLDQANGILAVMAKVRADPEKEACQSILFLKSKWQSNTVADWLAAHPDYSAPASVTASSDTLSGTENMKPEEIKQLVDARVKEALKKAGISEQGARTDAERAKAHFKITDEDWEKLTDEKRQEYIDQLPARGSGGNGGQGMTVDDLKAKIEQLATRRAEITSQLYPDPEPSTLTAEDRTKLEAEQETIWAEMDGLQKALAEIIAAQAETTLGEGYKVVLEVKLKEAEWDTEYINNLPDAAFAFIESGGEKDEDGKTTPRSLRHLPFKNAQGNLDHDHVIAALQRLDQTEISAEAKAEAKKKLCAAAKELGVESEVCGLTDQSEALRKKLTETTEELDETKGKLSDAEQTIAELKKKVPGGGLLANPPKVIPVTEAIAILESLLPSAVVEHSTMGMQRECQLIRNAILKLKERAAK